MPGSLLDRMRTGRLSRRRRARVRASFWLSLLELKSASISTGGEFCPVRLAVAANQKGSTTPQHTPPPGCLPDPSSYMAAASYSVNFRRRWTSLARGGASRSSPWERAGVWPLSSADRVPTLGIQFGTSSAELRESTKQWTMGRFTRPAVSTAVTTPSNHRK